MSESIINSTWRSLVAEPLGDPGGGGRRTKAHQGRLIRRGDDDDRPSESLGTEVALDELPDLAATFADHGDDVDVGRCVAGHHAEQRRLADARTGEHADALPTAERGERVPRPDAGRQRSVDARAAQWVRWLTFGHDALDDAERRAVVDRYTHAVEHAAEKGIADGNCDRVVIDVDACPDADSTQVTERHAAHAVTVDADHLADELTAIAAHPDTGTDRELQSFDVEAQSDHSGHGPGCLGCDVHAGHVEPVRQIGVEHRAPIGRWRQCRFGKDGHVVSGLVGHQSLGPLTPSLVWW